ncbi:MAG: ExbD/TolR family protein [Planctomycetota bacterium]
MRVPSVYSRADVGINMTPLIDIVFQLLIFFLVSSHLARQETQLPLPLPTSQLGIEEEAAEGVSRITVNLLMDGTVRLAGHKLMVSELPERLKQLRTTVDPATELRVRGDRSVPYEYVEPILQGCAAAGWSRVTFAVREPEGKNSSVPRADGN